MFNNRYLAANGNYPIEMRTEGCVHSTVKQWLACLVAYVLVRFGGALEGLGIRGAMRVVQYGLPPSIL